MKTIVKVGYKNEDWSKNDSVTHCKTSLHDFYKILDIEYPKIYKMDILSKKAFLLAEYLLQGQNFDPKSTAIFLWNEKSSIESDLKHQENIFNQIENPANFVYTLPNIAIGEIAIRHKITGETGFFISTPPSEQELLKTLEIYKTPYTQFIITGFIGQNEAFLQLFAV